MLKISSLWGSTNQSTVRYHFIPTRLALLKKKLKTNIYENVGKLLFSYIVDGNVNCDRCCGKQFVSSSKY